MPAYSPWSFGMVLYLLQDRVKTIPIKQCLQKRVLKIMLKQKVLLYKLCSFSAAQYGPRSMMAAESSLSCQRQWLAQRGALLNTRKSALAGHANWDRWGE